MVIFLCGFMGSGKSTLVRYAKDNRVKNLGPQFFGDLDYLVKTELGQKTISDCFVLEGENKFRATEFRLAYEWGQTHQNKELAILALGGGALSPQLMSYIKASRWIRLLWVNPGPDICFDRCFKENFVDRPLLAMKDPQELKQLYLKRESFYRQADDVLTGQSLIQDLIKMRALAGQ